METPSGFVRARRGGFSVDRKMKLSSLIANEIILTELHQFLETHYRGVQREVSLLDVGAGRKPYQVLYKNFFQRCVSVDVEKVHKDVAIDHIAPAHALPFSDASFDCLLCTEVLEHVPDPLAALKEFQRVLKPGGRLFLTTPFMVPLHEVPHDYYRYTPFALRQLAGASGLQLHSVEPRGDHMAVLLTYLQTPLSKFWYVLSKIARVNLNHPVNPLVYATIVLPQLAYLWHWRRVRKMKNGFLKRFYDRSSYSTLGYVSVLQKS